MVVLLPEPDIVYAQQAASTGAAPAGATAPAGAATEASAKMPADQLDALVAPVALYPDSLLAQTLVASTYPLEIVQLQQWLAKNPGLKDKALADAVAKQPWDPSIQSMAAVPEVVKRLSDDIQWTAELGNAFLAQQSDVMDAVQRMRKKAKDKGALESNKQQKVETQVVNEKTVIVVESADPQVVYVPSYSPTVVYGAPYPYYPYPPIYYPPYPAGAAFVSFSFGVMMGAAWGGACCGMGWGGNDININRNNNFNQINHNGGNRNQIGNGNNGGGRNQINGGGNGKWQHNPQHRGGAPYGDRGTANKYGGTARGDSLSSRQTQARQQGGAGTGNRGGGPSAGTSDRPGGGSRASGASTADRGASGGSRTNAPSTSDRSAGGNSRSSASGSRDTGGRSSSSSRSGGGFGGGSGGLSGSSARSSSSRGASSFGGRGGGGGGGRGGGGRRR